MNGYKKSFPKQISFSNNTKISSKRTFFNKKSIKFKIFSLLFEEK